MALSPQLLQFKSSGVYRLEFDKSQTSNINVDTLRLVVGHSKKGPYNTPVLIDSTEAFINVFGNIDKNLEKKGMFFHRSALAALSRGPILALNVNNFSTADIAYCQSLVTNGAEHSISSLPVTKSYESFFDTEKFMTPSDSKVLNTIAGDSDHILNFVNIKQEPITIIVRKAVDVAGFELTAREWYGEGNVPSYLHDMDYISDFMIDVYVFKGEFDAATMDTDPVYGSYFTEDGLLVDELEAFSNLRQVSLIARYTGSVLPDFKDLEGRNLYIQTAINAEARRTGLFCAIDEDAVTNETGTAVDFVGQTPDKDQDYELLSHITGQTVNSTTVNITGSTSSEVSNTVLTIAGFDATSLISAGDFLLAATSGEYAEITAVTYVDSDTKITCDVNISTTYDGTPATSLVKYSVSNARVVAYNPTATYEAQGTAFTFTFATTQTSSPITKGMYIPSVAAGRLAKVKQVSISGTVVTVKCDNVIDSSWNGEYVKSVDAASSVYKTFVLSSASIAGGEISDCLSKLSGTGLANALADKDIIDYRYIVDTFTSYDSSGLQNKSELSSLAKARQNASAILNAPTVADFKASTNPSFTDENGIFNTSYIADGGNLDKNPTSLYALPLIVEGANYAFYYGPGLIVRENGKDIIVPPAAWVSNNYIDKYTAALPWSIVAGPRRGVVLGSNVTGAEYAFDKADRDVLEPFGINPIVFQRGVGLTILGNKTAQQSIKSALSSAHVREVLIYIQEGIANILKDYVFEFNNVQTRLEIKTLVDSFLESVKQDGGVYDYKNVMDQTNNTNEVIDNNIGIIDTYVEPVKGLEIVVHRTTVLNTGEIQTGNFS